VVGGKPPALMHGAKTRTSRRLLRVPDRHRRRPIPCMLPVHHRLGLRSRRDGPLRTPADPSIPPTRGRNLRSSIPLFLLIKSDRGGTKLTLRRRADPTSPFQTRGPVLTYPRLILRPDQPRPPGVLLRQGQVPTRRPRSVFQGPTRLVPLRSRSLRVDARFPRVPRPSGRG
jgi:hypothetical protein